MEPKKNNLTSYISDIFRPPQIFRSISEPSNVCEQVFIPPSKFFKVESTVPIDYKETKETKLGDYTPSKKDCEYSLYTRDLKKECNFIFKKTKTGCCPIHEVNIHGLDEILGKGLHKKEEREDEHSDSKLPPSPPILKGS